MDKRERQRRRELQRTLYTLYRRRGAPADLYKVERNIPDVETGVERIQTTRVTVPMISFKANKRSLFDYDIAYMKANSNFVYGAQYEAKDRMGFFACNFELKKEDYFVIEGQRYNIFRFDSLDFSAGYIVHLRHTEGQNKPGRVHTYTYLHFLDFEQTIEYSTDTPMTDALTIEQEYNKQMVYHRTITHDLDFEQELTND